METKTVNCPECQSPNFYSANDELIRCRACGANIRIPVSGENQSETAEPIRRITSDTISGPGNRQAVPASMVQRFATHLVDQFVTAMVFVVLLIAGGSDGQTPDFNFYIAVVAIPIYYTLLEGSNGKTMGKLVSGTRVVHEDGSPIGYSTAFFRTLCRMIPFEVFSIFFHNGRCWHDLITRTFVINDRP